MDSKIDILINLYNSSTKSYLYDDVVIIENEDIQKDNFELTLKYISVENHYMIFLIITDNKLIFNGLLEDSNEKLSKKYELYLNDLKNLNENDFIDKYFEVLKSNL